MISFSEMNIAPQGNHFVGNKISILDILNEKITVHEYRIVVSKIEKGSGRCLHLQISYNDTNHVVFSGSENIMRQIESVAKENFPFCVTIKKKERLLYFA